MSHLNDLAAGIHQNAVDHGFWVGERNFGEMIALMHSELSEALEEHRQGRPSEWFQVGSTPVRRPQPGDGAAGADWVDERDPSKIWIGVVAKPEGVAVELADCLIRILDTLQSMDVDIDGVVARKMAYNKSRPYRHGRAY